MAFIQRERAERAATDLLRSDRPVADVGERVGWHDPNYFSRRFRTFFGCSPTAYRERFRKIGPPID